MTYDAVDDAMGSMRYDDISDGTVSKAAVSDRDMDDLVWSMLEDALTRGSFASRRFFRAGGIQRRVLMGQRRRHPAGGE